MIGFYTVPDSGDNVLKVLRPYQVYAAEKIWNVVSSSHWEQKEHKAGYVWHTTGSGKTLTSFKSAQLIAGMDKADKVVFLIDRVELGEQSYRDYQHFSNIDESINDTSNTDTLIRLLASDDNDEKVIITSIQKMCRVTEDNVSRLNFERIQRKKIVFIIDECHRDQNGTMHQSIENSFPNAMFFGFTGTPDEETTEIFGNELHRYSIADGIRDKNVLGFDSYMVCIYNDNDLREKVALEQVHAPDQESALANPNKRDNYLYFMNQGENVDRAMTGTNDARPDFQRMIRDSTNHVFGNVIVWKSDRIVRQWSCIRTLYVHHYGFGVEVKGDEWQKWLRQHKASR